MSRRVFLPESLQGLWDVMQAEPEALPYAGGTDVLVRLRKGMIDPPCLVCLERISELQTIEERSDELFIGAGATHAGILENQAIIHHLPVLTEALRVLGAPAVRHMGTIGGNIVTASPAGDTLPPLYVLEAEVEVRSSDRSKRIPIKDFVLGPGRTALAKGEILSGIWVRKPVDFTIHHYEKIGQRKALAISIVSLAALVGLSESGIIKKARLAWGSVGPTVVTAPQVERALEGKPLSLETLNHVVPMIQEVVSPIDDVRAKANYRRRTAGNLILRLLQQCRSADRITDPRRHI